MRLFDLLLILAFFSIGNASAAELDPSKFWSTFRKTAPFPLQDIIASPISPSGEAVVILTEPPAEVWANRETVVKAAFGEEFASIEVHAYPVGYDGWVKDIVLRLRNVDEAALAQGVQFLSKAFYRTTYGASYRTLQLYRWDESAEPRRRLGPPNLQISAASLNKWLFESPLDFVNRTANEEGIFVEQHSPRATLVKLFQESSTGVFHSTAPGLVLLVFDRNRLMNDSVARLRQFSLDSDALLGAVAKQNSSLMVLIGRKRSTPISDMPPLRVDTILTLAAATEENLAQSYERNAPLAGPTSNMELRQFLDPHPVVEELNDPATSKFPRATAADWAPILLSRELTNTEYGQLLNITDQLLKGWSMGNLIAYGNFPYPAPARFPHPNGIYEHMQGRLGGLLTELTFNWNTAGFGAWTNFGMYQIFSVLNSNALPISYIPDVPQTDLSEADHSLIRDAEDEYGRYYAELRDPNLNRVAQYAALHMIFTRFPVKAVRTEPLVAQDVYERRWNGFKTTVAEAVRKLARSIRGEDYSGSATTAENTVEERDGSDRACGLVTILRSIFALQESAGAGGLVTEYGTDESRLARLVDAMVDPSSLNASLFRQYDLMYKEIDDLTKNINAFNWNVDHCNKNPASPQCQIMEAESERLNREQGRLIAQQEELNRQAEAFRQLSEDGRRVIPLLPLEGDCTAAWQSVRDGNANPTGSVLKTPSIVISTDIQGQASGGHNLDGRSIEVIADPLVPRGSIRADEGANVLRLNPDEISKSTIIGREFERMRIAFLNGDAATKRQIESRIASSLSSDTAPAKPFTAGALALKEDGFATRALGSESGRQVVGTYSVDIPEAQLASASRLAEETQADLVIGFKHGEYSLIDPGPPPVGLGIKSPASMFRVVEAKAKAAAVSGAADGKFVVVSDGTLSIAEMDGVRITGQTRQLIASAGGGGGRVGQQPGETLGMFFESGPGGSGRKGRDWLSVFPFRDSVHKLLTRHDADWTNASLDYASVKIEADNKSIVGRLEIPFVKTDAPVTVRFKALFTGRLATLSDVDTFKSVVGNEIENVPDGTTIITKLTNIKRAFEKEMNDNAQLEARLRQNNDDFFVVELVLDEQFRKPS